MGSVAGNTCARKRIRVSTHVGHRQRLRDCFRKSGLKGFADYEIVELLLTLAIPRSDVKQPAKELIHRFGDLRGILDAPSADLRTVPGIGKVAPVALKILKAAATLYLQQESEAGEFLADPSRLENFWRMRLGALTNEVFEVAVSRQGGHVRAPCQAEARPELTLYRNGTFAIFTSALRA